VGLFVCGCGCLWVCVCLWVCYHDNSKLHEGSDHLQPIKFWPSCAPETGICGGANFFGSALLQPARSVCVSPGACFISSCAIVTLSLRRAVFFRYSTSKNEIRVRCHSRSLKEVPFDRLYGFLLVFFSNFVPKMYRF